MFFPDRARARGIILFYVRRETRRTRKRSWSYLLLSSRRIEGRDDSARIVINKQTRAFHIRAVKRAPAIFLIIPGIQKAKQPVKCRASDGYSINYDAGHPCRDRHPFSLSPSRRLFLYDAREHR